MAENPSPPMSARPDLLAWAHQGGACEGPSNTIAAMARAVDPRGGAANALEFDVHVDADGVAVVIHDATVQRTTNGTGKVARMRSAELQELDAAYWWASGKVVDRHAPVERYTCRGMAATDPDYRIPTLVAVLDRFPDWPLTIEVKKVRAASPVVDEIVRRGRAEVTLTSFRTLTVWRVRWALRAHRGHGVALAPGLGYTVWFWLRSTVRVPPRRSPYDRIQVPTRKLGMRFTTPRFIDDAHAAGLDVDVWTIDDPDTMEALLALGVDGILTDRPSVLAGVLRSRAGAPEDGSR